MTGKLRKVFLGLGLASCLSVMSVGCVFAAETTEQATAEQEITTAPIECEDDDISEKLQATLAYTSEDNLKKVMEYSDEELADKIENGTDFEKALASAWSDSKEEVGAFVSIQQHEITENNRIYTVVTTVEFENKEADLTITYDDEPTATGAVIDVEKSFAQNMQEAGMNFILGIGTVFIMLVFLSFVISLLKPLTDLLEGKKKEAPAPAQAPAAAPAVVEEEEEELVDDLELVAVITAAIAASENTSSDGFVVRSIKRANNRKWQKA
ncbi:MAG: OadG family transporter subunit [Lachnospiraceae bacterium]|nr:OadG family transporter subunit [Lachnospiraceae bacterium]